jgi:hypothetical protein
MDTVWLPAAEQLNVVFEAAGIANEPAVAVHSKESMSPTSRSTAVAATLMVPPSAVDAGETTTDLRLGQLFTPPTTTTVPASAAEARHCMRTLTEVDPPSEMSKLAVPEQFVCPSVDVPLNFTAYPRPAGRPLRNCDGVAEGSATEMIPVMGVIPFPEIWKSTRKKLF